MSNSHIPVLLKEAIAGLSIKDNGLYIDCTFGAGGHSRAILESNKTAKLIALDRDINNKTFADQLKLEFGERFVFANELFSNIDKVVSDMKLPRVDGILYDIGVSSMQIDNRERGFSFQESGRLDMRMGKNDLSAHDLVNEYSELDIANILFQYGDERKSRIIAKKIIKAREVSPIETTVQLANIIEQTIGRRKHQKIHPATKSFQAIRIYINNELKEFEDSLNKSVDLLHCEGRICAITFHSLEDSIAKKIFKENSLLKNKAVNRHDPFLFLKTQEVAQDLKLKMINKKPIVPNDFELNHNIRARSAKLRIVEKL